MKTRIPVVLIVLLFAGCLGRGTSHPVADGTAAVDSATEAAPKATPAASPEMTPEAAPAGEEFGPWIYEAGSRKRWGPFVENDTTFLYVEEYPLGSDTNHYKVFIRKAPQSADNLNFTLLTPQNERDWTDFSCKLRELKKSRPEPLPRHAALKELPQSWTPVRSFGGNYYVDGLRPYPVWISDSLFVRQFMDGPCLSPVDAAERISPTHYRLRTSAGYSDVDRVDIHLVDTARSIAVFAFGNDENPACIYALYAPFQSGLKMDMVDYYSLELPEDEVAWDEIDYEALIAASVGEGSEKSKNNEE